MNDRPYAERTESEARVPISYTAAPLPAHLAPHTMATSDGHTSADGIQIVQSSPDEVSYKDTITKPSVAHSARSVLGLRAMQQSGPVRWLLAAPYAMGIMILLGLTGVNQGMAFLWGYCLVISLTKKSRSASMRFSIMCIYMVVLAIIFGLDYLV